MDDARDPGQILRFGDRPWSPARSASLPRFALVFQLKITLVAQCRPGRKDRGEAANEA